MKGIHHENHSADSAYFSQTVRPFPMAYSSGDDERDTKKKKEKKDKRPSFRKTWDVEEIEAFEAAFNQDPTDFAKLQEAVPDRSKYDAHYLLCHLY